MQDASSAMENSVIVTAAQHNQQSATVWTCHNRTEGGLALFGYLVIINIISLDQSTMRVDKDGDSSNARQGIFQQRGVQGDYM